MRSTITCEDFVTAIQQQAEGKFIAEIESGYINKLLSLTSDKLNQKKVIRLKRKSVDKCHWRTFIISICRNVGEIDSVFRWSAEVKTELLDPEGSDLYLIAASEANDISFEDCIQIECSEQFCRKFILRPEEKVIDLINRTFLGTMQESGSINEIADPLQAALIATAAEKDWFSNSIRNQWYSAFFSGETGEGLIAELFKDHNKNISTNEAQ